MSALVVLPGTSHAVQIGGLGVVFELVGKDTDGRVSVVEHPLAPGALAGPRHTHHNEDEISYVLEGEFTIQVGDQVIKAPVGTLIYKPRGVPHTFWNQTSSPARLLEIILPSGLETYFEELAELVKYGPPPDMSSLVNLAKRYDLDIDLASIPELAQKYHVTLEPPR